MRVGVVGLGAVGARAVRQLVAVDRAEVLVQDIDSARVAELVAAYPGEVTAADTTRIIADSEIVVLATPSGTHRRLAATAIRAGVGVVTVSDSLDDVRALLELDHEAAARGLPVVVGAGFAPGLTCVMAAHAARQVDRVDEIHTAKLGTGGPACARQHHRALGSTALEWHEHRWVERPGGSGRELLFFPEPISGADCYRGAFPDPILLHDALTGAGRVTARMAATRRDRLTARLPMLRPPHAEGGLGAVRVEVRGRLGSERVVAVFGAVDHPAVAAGAVVAVAVRHALAGRLRSAGAGGLARLAEPGPFLADLRARGVRVAVFEGSTS